MLYSPMTGSSPAQSTPSLMVLYPMLAISLASSSEKEYLSQHLTKYHNKTISNLASKWDVMGTNGAVFWTTLVPWNSRSLPALSTILFLSVLTWNFDVVVSQNMVTSASSDAPCLTMTMVSAQRWVSAGSDNNIAVLSRDKKLFVGLDTERNNNTENVMCPIPPKMLLPPGLIG